MKNIIKIKKKSLYYIYLNLKKTSMNYNNKFFNIFLFDKKKVIKIYIFTSKVAKYKKYPSLY